MANVKTLTSNQIDSQVLLAPGPVHSCNVAGQGMATQKVLKLITLEEQVMQSVEKENPMGAHKLESSWRTFAVHNFRRNYGRWLVGGSVMILIAILLYPWRDMLVQLVSNQEALQYTVNSLGWWGPVLLIGLNIMQIVIAPIPGYGVYLAAGILYGPWWGGLWGSVGLLFGSMVAMAIGRHLGRPVVQRIIGDDQLQKWERVTRSNSPLLWGVILLSPIGDTPFLLAGLSSVPYRLILLFTIIMRVPAAFAAAAVGAGALHLTWWQLTLIVVALALPLGLLYRYRDVAMEWYEEKIQRFIQ